MASLSSVNSSSTAVDQIVEAYKNTQSYRVEALQTKLNTYQTQSSFYSGLGSKINSLVSALDKYGSYKKVDSNFTFTKDSDIDTDFVKRSATTSNKDVMTVKADGDAAVAVHSLKVNTLATNDILVTKRMNLADAFGMSAGDYSFTLSQNSVDYEVKVNLTGTETNEEAMRKISDAINKTEIVNPKDSKDTDPIELNSSFVKDTETTGRISLMSKDTGADYNITFSSSPLLEKLGLTTSMYSDPAARTTQSGETAGYKKADKNALNSKLEVNGIEISRNSNEIDDVIEGLTFNLLQAQDAGDEAVTVKSSIDTDAVIKTMEPIITAYNSIMTYLTNYKTMMKTDSAATSLQTRMRALSSTQFVESSDANTPKYLSDLGYKIGSDGTISMDDKTKLTDILEKDGGAQMVADMFTSATGFAKKMNDVTANYRTFGTETGLIKSRTSSLTSLIDSTNDRISDVQASIDTSAESIRDQYEAYLESYYSLMGTSSLYSVYTNSAVSNSNSSLLSSYYSSQT